MVYYLLFTYDIMIYISSKQQMYRHLSGKSQPGLSDLEKELTYVRLTVSLNT